MAITYLLTGGNFPVPIAPPTAVIGQPTTPFNGAMQAANTASQINQYAVASDVARVQYGVGGYAVLGSTPSGAAGLQLTSVSGLNIAISAGVAALDGDYEFITSGNAFGPQALLLATYTMYDNSTNFVWLTLLSGDPGIAVSTTAGAPPLDAKLYLGAVTTVSGAVTGVDYSGRVEMNGGTMTRLTGDVGVPVDSPPAGWGGYTQTLFGTFYWNGTSHVYQPSGQETFNFASNASVTLVQPYLSASILNITDTHPYLSGGVNVVFPTIKSPIPVVVYNATAQTLTLKTSGGTGFTLATTKRVLMYIDGTDCRDVTAAN